MTGTAFRRRSCPLCGSSAAREEVHSRLRAESLVFDAVRPFWSGLFKEKLFFSYHRCGGCGLLYTPVFFDADQLTELYAHMAPNMDAVPGDAIGATQRGYYRHAERTAPLGGGYLEIGPDVGHLAEVAARRGGFDHFWLYEPNRAVHDTLRRAVGRHAITLSTDMDDLSAVPDGTVGLAVMVHVLDHLLDPVAMLEKIRPKLRPDGLLMAVTHNEGSLLRNVMGTRWPPFCLQHPELYNTATLRRLMKRAGFARVSVRRSRNHFPLDFLLRQAAWTVGLKLPPLPFRSPTIGLRLGNMIALARPEAAQAASRDPAVLERAA